MNRVIRPGVWLVFLVTGMSATAFASAVKSERAGGQAPVAVSRTAALFCYVAILGSGTQTQASSSNPDLNRLAMRGPESPLPSLPGGEAPSLGAAKMSHFGRFSARRE